MNKLLLTSMMMVICNVASAQTAVGNDAAGWAETWTNTDPSGSDNSNDVLKRIIDISTQAENQVAGHANLIQANKDWQSAVQDQPSQQAQVAAKITTIQQSRDDSASQKDNAVQIVRAQAQKNKQDQAALDAAAQNQTNSMVGSFIQSGAIAIGKQIPAPSATTNNYYNNGN